MGVRAVRAVTQRAETAGRRGVAMLQDGVEDSDVHPEAQAADAQQLAETHARRHHRRRVEALQSQAVHLLT